MKLSLETVNTNLAVKGSNFLKEGLLVMVMAPGKPPVQITFHRPLGKTPHSPDEWIATPTSDVSELLRRLVDPYEVQRKQQVEQECLAHAVSQGWLFEGQEGLEYWDGELRSHFKKCLREDPEQTLKLSDTALKAAVEKSISEMRATLIAKIESVPGYETMSGLEGNRPQKPISSLKGMTLDKVVDKIVKQLASLPEISESKAKPPAPQVAPAVQKAVASAPKVQRQQPNLVPLNEAQVRTSAPPQEFKANPPPDIGKGERKPKAKMPTRSPPSLVDYGPLAKAIKENYSQNTSLKKVLGLLKNHDLQTVVDALDDATDDPIVEGVRYELLQLDSSLRFRENDQETEPPDANASVGTVPPPNPD